MTRAAPLHFDVIAADAVSAWDQAHQLARGYFADKPFSLVAVEAAPENVQRSYDGTPIMRPAFRCQFVAKPIITGGEP